MGTNIVSLLYWTKQLQKTLSTNYYNCECDLTDAVKRSML